MTAMTISQLAKSGGVRVEAVRYYQRRGLQLGNIRHVIDRRATHGADAG